MRLTDLDAHFIGNRTADGSFVRMTSLFGAQGVMFQCPKCAEGKERGEEDGRRFVHSVICWFKTPIGADPVPDDAFPKPGRWNPSGTSLDDLTFVEPGAVSVLLTGEGCGWHGFVRNGEATLS